MDDAQCGENIKAWGCAIIVNGTKETNLKWWATINRKVTITISEVFHVFFRQRSKKFLVAIFAFIISFYISFYIQFIIYNFSYNFWLSSHVLVWIRFIPKTKKTASTVNNIILALSLKRFCMRDVCTLKHVGKLRYFLPVIKDNIHSFLWIFI